MSTGFLAQLRECRRPLIAVAVALIVLQTLVAGLATAQAAARLSAGPFDGSVICHGAGGADRDADGAPASGAACEMCCALCAATAPVLVSVTLLLVGHIGHADRLPVPARQPILTVRYAVRAGPSRAPPSLA